MQSAGSSSPMSQSEPNRVDENRDAVRRILERRRVAAKEPHFDMLRSLADTESGWRWADNIDWDDVVQPLIDADLVARDVIPQPDDSYRDRIRITKLGRKQHRQIEAEIDASPWIHTDGHEAD